MPLNILKQYENCQTLAGLMAAEQNTKKVCNSLVSEYIRILRNKLLVEQNKSSYIDKV